MKRLQRLAAASTMLFCLGLSHAYAEPLTSEQVGRFIASMPELTALGEKYQDSAQRNIDPRRPLGSSLELMGGKGQEYADLAQLAARHGFSSPEQWADVGDRTMQAYQFASSPVPPDQVDAMYQQGIANILKDAKLSAEQKQLILGRMEKTHSGNQQARQVVEKDIPALKPHMAELDKLFE